MSHIPEPDESSKPTAHTIGDKQLNINKDARAEVVNNLLTAAQIEQDLSKARIETFKVSIKRGMQIVVSLIILLYITIIVYLVRVLCAGKDGIPADFWHIPLMLVFMSSTILSVILIQSAKFGALDNKAKDNQNSDTSLAQTLPLVKEITDLIDKVKK